MTSAPMYNMELLNGNHLGTQPAFPGQNYGTGNKNNITLEQVDPSAFADDDSEDECNDDFSRGIKPGKKTKGRVKIKMEFIENKLRRYTTFSKRKTGIMKKAYELSTLTGTQVMLLVASETGHVYTFATRKLQPMITSESGKALIQTCLNSPDPPPMAPGQQQAVEQRMNPGGFEETELTYAVDDETGKLQIAQIEGSNGSHFKPTYSLSNSSSSESLGVIQTQQQQPAHQGQTYQISSTPQTSSGSMNAVVQQSITVVNSSQPNNQPSQAKSVSAGGIAYQLPANYPGFIIQPGNTFTIPAQGNQQQQQQLQQPQTVYRISTQAGGQQILTSSPVIQSDTGQRPQSNASTNTTAQQTTVLSAGTQQSSPALTPSVYMYQTPQGIVYAPATGTIHDKTILNFQQQTAALSVQQDPGGQQQSQQQQQHPQQQQHIITIPVPVSLAGSQQILQLAPDTQNVPDAYQPSAAKKQRK